MTPLIRQGEGQHGIHRHLAELAHHRANLERIIRIATADTDTTPHHGTAGGDNTRLRGIPAIGPGVTGAIPGTAPHTRNW